MTDLNLRPAHKSECRTIAELYRISSDGVADYIWSKMAAPGQDILEVGQQRYAREGTPFSYENCTLALSGGAIAGMLVAFPMHIDPDAGEEEDPVLAPYARLEADNSYYICGMALFPPFRGQGTGSRFLAHAESAAVRLGLPRLSLIVFEQNAGAKRLYDRQGFLTVAREPVVPHPLIHFTGDALLMVRELR